MRTVISRAKLVDGRVRIAVAIAPPVQRVVGVEIVTIANRSRHGVCKLAQRLLRNAQGHSHHHEFVPQHQVSRHSLFELRKVFEPLLKRAALCLKLGTLLRKAAHARAKDDGRHRCCHANHRSNDVGQREVADKQHGNGRHNEHGANTARKPERGTTRICHKIRLGNRELNPAVKLLQRCLVCLRMLARIALELFERTRLHARRVLLSAQEIEIQSVEVGAICDLFLRRLTTRNAIVVLILNRLLNLNDPLVGEFHERRHKCPIRHLGVADVHKGSNGCRMHTLGHVAEIRILEYRGRLLFQ